MLTALKSPISLFSSIFPTVCSSYAIFPYVENEIRNKTGARCTDSPTLSTVIQNSMTHRSDCWSLCLTMVTEAVVFIFSSGRQPRTPRTMVAGSTTRLKLLSGFITARASNRDWTVNGSACRLFFFSRTLAR